MFDNIRAEIEEIFIEYTVGVHNTPSSYALARQLLGLQYQESFGARRSIKGECMHFKDGELKHTKHRYDSLYNKAGQITTAYQLLKSGLYSAREVSRCLQMSINTVCKLLKADDSLKCVCGKPLSKHRGWCSHRFMKSETRQLFIKNWAESRMNIKLIGKTRLQIESMVYELDTNCEKGTDTFIAACLLLTIVHNGTIDNIHLCIAVDGATPDFTEIFCANLVRYKALNINEGTNKAYIVWETDDPSVTEFWLYVMLGLGKLARK